MKTSKFSEAQICAILKQQEAGIKVAETTWAYRVAIYTSIGWARKEHRRQRRNQPFNGQEQFLKQPTEPEDPRVDWLYQQIEKLAPLDRSLAVLLLDGCTYEQMASILGITANHVGVKINRIKKHLIKNLKEQPNDDL